MATIKLKRGQESNRSTITPAAGEPLVSLDTKELFVGDGETAGGFPVGTLKSAGQVKAGYVAVFRDDNSRELEAIDLNAQLTDYAKETTVDTKIATVSGQITNVEAKADNGISKADAAQTTADEALGVANGAQQAVNTLTTTVDTVNTLAQDNQTAIQSVTSTANSANIRSTNNAGDINTLQTKVESLETGGVTKDDFNNLKSDVGANTQRFDTLPSITSGTTVPDDTVGKDLDLFIQVT